MMPKKVCNRIEHSILQIHISYSVTDFSFVSIEVGIPFATSDNALTIYNCTAALRYELLLLVTCTIFDCLYFQLCRMSEY